MRSYACSSELRWEVCMIQGEKYVLVLYFEKYVWYLGVRFNVISKNFQLLFHRRGVTFLKSYVLFIRNSRVPRLKFHCHDGFESHIHRDDKNTQLVTKNVQNSPIQQNKLTLITFQFCIWVYVNQFVEPLVPGAWSTTISRTSQFHLQCQHTLWWNRIKSL